MKSLIFFETENITLNIINEKIVHTYIKDFKKATIKDAKNIRGFLNSHYKDQQLVSLFEFGVESTINQELREYLADPNREKYSNKVALLVKNLNQQLVGSSFLKYQNPSFPTKVFYDKHKAIDWLIKD